MIRYTIFFISWFLLHNVSGQQIKKEYLLRGVDDSLLHKVVFDQDFYNETVTLSVKDQSLKIFGVQDLKSQMIHEKVFLELQFRVRSGSGGKVKRSVLICVSEGKVFKSMDFYSESVWQFNEVYEKVADSLKLFDEKSIYDVALSIKQTEGNDFNAVLFESIKVESKFDPSQNLSFEKPYELYFDRNEHFFYNSTKKMNGLYKVYYNRENKTIERLFSFEVPCIKLYQKIYLRINGEWFQENDHDSLSCL